MRRSGLVVDNQPMPGKPFVIVRRFFSVFISEIATIKHHSGHAVLAGLVIVCDYFAFGHTWEAIQDHLWEELAPFLWAASLVVIFHSVRSAAKLIKLIRAEHAAPMTRKGKF